MWYSRGKFGNQPRTRAHAHTHTRARTHTHTHTHTHVETHSHTHTNRRTRVHAHTHIHTRPSYYVNYRQKGNNSRTRARQECSSVDPSACHFTFVQQISPRWCEVPVCAAVNRSQNFTQFTSRRLCPSTAGCSPPPMPSIVACYQFKVVPSFFAC